MILAWRRQDLIAYAAYGVAVLLYAVFSSPTPDTPGMIELLVILCLLLASGMGGFVQDIFKPFWAKPLAVLILYGASVPLLIGIVDGAEPSDILRDMVAFGALTVPLFLSGIFLGDNPRAMKILLYSLLFVGLCFSVRYFFTADIIILTLGNGPFDDRLLYLANSPLVPFTAFWLLLQGCFVERKISVALLMIFLACIPIIAMAGMMQRATLVLLSCTWVFGLIVTFVRVPGRGLIVACGAGVVGFLAWPYIYMLADALLEKTLTVGLNARAQELSTLYQAQSQNILTSIFGVGWGSMIKSPAVGDLWVRFSHSLLTSLWWKTGWIGLLLGGAALISLTIHAYTRLRGDWVLFISFMVPFNLALFLYGSYKSLCFGLLLLGFAQLTLQKERDTHETA